MRSRYFVTYVLFATMICMVTLFQNCGPGFRPELADADSTQMSNVQTPDAQTPIHQ